MMLKNIILVIGGLITIAMGLYPPFEITLETSYYDGGSMRIRKSKESIGYEFIGDKPWLTTPHQKEQHLTGVSIDFPLLIVQWITLIISLFIAYLISGNLVIDRTILKAISNKMRNNPETIKNVVPPIKSNTIRNICPDCKVEYDDHDVVCEDCGVKLEKRTQ